MKVAIVHDYLHTFGGAERVIIALHEMYPEAPIYTSVYQKKNFPQLKDANVKVSVLNKVPLINKIYRMFTFFYPLIFEAMDLEEYDLVISTSAIWAKGVLTKPPTLHIGYIHTPPRFLYGYPRSLDKRSVLLLSFILKPLDMYLRMWDFAAAQRPDYLIGNSKTIVRRIKKHYHREATYIYPPVEVEKFFNTTHEIGDYYLVVSRLERYKNVDVVIKAFNQLNIPLRIIGTGKREGELKKQANSNIQLLGFVDDMALKDNFAKAKAVICLSQDEDFGLVPLEAMASGRPAICLREGGYTETVIEGKTGEFVNKVSSEDLVRVIKGFVPDKYLRETCVQQATRFSKDKFKEKWESFVKEKLADSRE